MKCDDCVFYRILNPHEMRDGKPVEHCANGLLPEQCRYDYVPKSKIMRRYDSLIDESSTRGGRSRLAALLNRDEL